MIWLILILLAFVAVVYLFLWLKSRWDRLSPQHKKQIMFLGMNSLFNFLRLKWQVVLMVIWQILKRFIRK